MEKKEVNISTEGFEEMLAQADESYYSLQLYIAGSTLYSNRALRNLRQICDRYLKGRYELEVIDIYQCPERVLPENIVAIPTLVKKLPPPLQRLIGDLSHTEKVLVGLNLLPQDDSQT